MRLWTLHPKHLDRQGLLALWREGLLAQKVLQNRTRGYRRHPQLIRFKQHPTPVAAIATYMADIAREAAKRGYHFNTDKLSKRRTPVRIKETTGQLRYEQDHLRKKLLKRQGLTIRSFPAPLAHPLFLIVKGPIQPWEKQP